MCEGSGRVGSGAPIARSTSIETRGSRHLGELYGSGSVGVMARDLRQDCSASSTGRPVNASIVALLTGHELIDLARGRAKRIRDGSDCGLVFRRSIDPRDEVLPDIAVQALAVVSEYRGLQKRRYRQLSRSYRYALVAASARRTSGSMGRLELRFQ